MKQKTESRFSKHLNAVYQFPRFYLTEYFLFNNKHRINVISFNKKREGDDNEK